MSNKKYDLATIQEEKNALEVFSTGNVNKLIEDIESEVNQFVFDVSTAKGRKEIASLAHKVSRSKTALDALGKDLVSEWKTKSKAVDAERKLIRDRLDEIRDNIRRPLTDWDEAEKARIKADIEEKELIESIEQAAIENELFDRLKEIERKEEKQKQIELKRIEKARIEAEEKAKLEAEEKIRIEAEAKAKKEAEENAYRKIKEAENLVINAKIAEETARKEAEESKIRIKLAEEQAKLDAEQSLKDSELRIAIELKQQKARIQKEAYNKERDRIRIEAKEKLDVEKKAANKAHQKAINNRIMIELDKLGIDPKTAKKLIIKIVKHEIDNITINY